MYNPYNWTINKGTILGDMLMEIEEKELMKEYGKKCAERDLAHIKYEMLKEECDEIRQKIRNLYI